MATPWLSRIKKDGQLAVFNKAAAWAKPVEAGLRSFNSLAFAVTLVAAKEEKAANIVLVMASGPEQYTYAGMTLKTNEKFKPDGLHGQTSFVVDQRRQEVFFACTFLPGKVAETNDAQKEMIVVHELIHASGLSDDDHDIVGIFTGQMQKSGDGLLEYLPEKGAKPMPPIRVGSRTMCKMRLLWTDAESCK
jgi:hypothetical protein